MSDEQFLALLAAVCGCIPGRADTTIGQDIAMAQEYLDAARNEIAPRVSENAVRVSGDEKP